MSGSYQVSCVAFVSWILLFVLIERSRRHIFVGEIVLLYWELSRDDYSPRMGGALLYLCVCGDVGIGDEVSRCLCT